VSGDGCDHLFAIGLDDNVYCRKCYLCLGTERLLAGYCHADAAEARVKELEQALRLVIDGWDRGVDGVDFVKRLVSCRRILSVNKLGEQSP
jgi:hypothetical protein